MLALSDDTNKSDKLAISPILNQEFATNQTARQLDIANLYAATQTQDVSQQTIMAELQRVNQALSLELRTQIERIQSDSSWHT